MSQSFKGRILDLAYWIIDSGATNHMTNEKLILKNFKNKYDDITIANGQNVAVIGQGDLEVKLNEDSIVLLKDVLYVPTLKKILISVGQMTKNGFNIKFQTDNRIDVSHNGEILFRGQMNNVRIRVRILITKIHRKA